MDLFNVLYNNLNIRRIIIKGFGKIDTEAKLSNLVIDDSITIHRFFASVVGRGLDSYYIPVIDFIGHNNILDDMFIRFEFDYPFDINTEALSKCYEMSVLLRELDDFSFKMMLISSLECGLIEFKG
jgi:hypothetical protein